MYLGLHYNNAHTWNIHVMDESLADFICTYALFHPICFLISKLTFSYFVDQYTVLYNP